MLLGSNCHQELPPLLISHEELSSLIDDNVYVPSYVLQYKASETRADGTNPNAELNQKIRQEIAAREMMATLPKYMRKMAIDAENAEAFVSVVEEKNRKDHKKLPDAEGRFLLKRYYSYVNNPSGREMIADFKRTFANREGIIRLRDKLISSTVSRSVVRNEKGRLERKRIRTFRTPANELVARLARLSRRSTENELDSAIAEIEKNPIPYMAEYYRMLARNREPLPYGFRNPIGLINQLYMKDDDYQFLRIDSQVATLFDEIYDDPVIAEAYNLGEDVMRSVMTPYEEVEEMRNATDETISADINETKENFKAVRNSLNFATKKLKELQRDYEKAMDTISGLWLDDEVQRLTLNQGNIERLQEISDAITEEAEKLYHDHPELQLSEDSLGNYTGRASHQINRELPYSEQLDQLLSKHKAYLDMVTNVRLNEKLDKQGRMLTDRMKQQHDDLWEKINTARDEAHRNLVAYNRYYRKYTTLLRNHLRQKIDRNIKKRLAFNSSTHDVMLEDVVYWLYYYMHDGQHRMFSNSEVLTDEDYDILRFARGEVDEKGFDVAMYKLDSNGNPVDGQPPFEGNLGSYRFHQDQMPSLLSDILPESLKEKVATTRYADLSLEDRQAILNGLSLARKRAKDRYESIRDARNNQLRESENRMTARIFGENFIYNTTEEDIEIVKARIPGRDYDNMSQEDLAALVQDFKRKHPGLFFTAKELEPGLKGKLKGALDTVSLWFMMIEPFVRKLDGKLYGVFHEEFIDKPMRAYQDKIRQKGRRLEDADNLFSSTLGDKGSKKRKENLSWLREEHGGFNYNDLKKGKRSLTGNQMLGAYVYSQNINGFKNLYSSEGNSLSLESLARINPLAIQQVIEAELRTRAEYEADRIYRETNGLVPQVYTPTLLYRETNAHLNELLRKIQNGEIASVLPESMRKLGDGMIDLLAKEQQRYADVVYDVYNQKMVFQERYFPLIADAKMAPGTNVGEDGHKGSKMPFAGNKELRDKNAVYPLVLNPIATFLSAIETQENFINMSKPVRNLNSMMSEHGGGLKPMLTNRYGEKYVKFLENYIGRLAGGTEKLDDMERLVNRFLGNIAVSKISLNLMTSLKQITSIIPALTDGEISVNNLASAFYEMAMSKDKVYDTVDSLAPEIMTSEMNLEYQRLHEASLGDPLSGKFSAIREFGMKPVEAVDHMVKVAVWYASFEKNIEYGMNEQEAASRASSLVQRTQSMSDPFSLSEAQAHRNPFYRAVFLFTNDLFHMWNILFGHAWSDWQEGNRWNAFRRFGGAIASAALLSFLAMGWAPDDDDDKNFDEREFGRDFISNMLQYMTPGIGHLWQDALGGFPRETWGIMKELAQTGRMFTNLEDYNGEEIAGQILDVATEATAPLGMPIIMADRTINVFKPENGGSLAFNPFYFFGSNTGDAMDVWFGLNDLMD